MLKRMKEYERSFEITPTVPLIFNLFPAGILSIGDIKYVKLVGVFVRKGNNMTSQVCKFDFYSIFLFLTFSNYNL